MASFIEINPLSSLQRKSYCVTRNSWQQTDNGPTDRRPGNIMLPPTIVGVGITVYYITRDNLIIYTCALIVAYRKRDHRKIYCRLGLKHEK